MVTTVLFVMENVDNIGPPLSYYRLCLERSFIEIYEMGATVNITSSNNMPVI